MWKVNQNVLSQAEPELGLGVLSKINASTLEVTFHKTKVKRLYSKNRAPIRRFTLQVGQKAYDFNSQVFTVERIENHNGLMKYFSKDHVYWEYEISEKVESISTALTHLFSGQLSDFKSFDLRKKTWLLKSNYLRSPARGLLGARVQPIKHQLYIASKVSERLFPRVLLADEVGLGKTIEACLIYSRLRAIGRAEKVLILTPPSLVNQWTAEMYRRFGELFCILNEERSLAEENTQGMSAFAANQKIIAPLNFLGENPLRLQQALEEDWDLIIFDEAHKLEWSEEEPNDLWLMSKALSTKTKSLLLLTATPQQKGTETQFGLLHLVDPEKFPDFESFLENLDHLKNLRQCVQYLENAQWDTAKALLKALYPKDHSLLSAFDRVDSKDTLSDFLNILIDRHGTGRVYFRNRRQKIKGFPKRTLCSIPLECSKDLKEHLEKIEGESTEDKHLVDYATGRSLKRTFQSHPSHDSRFAWIQSFLSQNHEKILVICANKERVEQLAAFLDPQYNQLGKRKISIFHEGLSIIDRDLQAAWFSRNDGAQVLISSEIGGEGRNFQFVKKLVLFDLPMHPDLLEQRIGRLDRIGQGSEIEIFVPWQKESPEEVLFRWYHEGLNAFEQFWNGAASTLEEYSEELLECFRFFLNPKTARNLKEEKLETLLKNTQKTALRIRQEITNNIDTLIDFNSFNEHSGNKILESIDHADDDTSLEFYIREVFDFYGVDYEDYDQDGSILVKGGSLSFIEDFPLAAKEEDFAITFNRRKALAREDMLFLSLDHPLIESTFDHLLQHEGTASFCQWEHSPFGKGALIQLTFVIEAKGRKDLQLERYFPLQMKSIVFDHKGNPIHPSKLQDLERSLVDLSDKSILNKVSDLKNLIIPLVDKFTGKFDTWLEKEKEKSIKLAKEHTQKEMDRLKALLEINPLVSEKEVLKMQEIQEDVLTNLKGASYHIDAIRIILTS